MNLSTLVVPAVAALALFAGAAAGGPRDQASAVNFVSDTGGACGGMYGTLVIPITASYAVQYVVVSGTYVSQTGFGCESDAVLELRDTDNNVLATVRPFSGCTGFSSTVSNHVVRLPRPIAVAPGSALSIRATETYNDSNAAADGIWSSLNVLLDDGPPFWLFVADAGSVRSPGFSLVNQPIAPGTIRWYKLQLPVDAGNLGAFGTTYLDIDTEGSPHADMEIALFDADGRLIATDDDGGSGTQARLSFGAAPSRPAFGDGLPYDNSGGVLSAGIYYLALGPFDATFGPTSWIAGTSSPAQVTGQINVRTNLDWSAFCRGDTNRNGSVSVQDIFDFLTAYFAGCP